MRNIIKKFDDYDFGNWVSYMNVNSRHFLKLDDFTNILNVKINNELSHKIYEYIEMGVDKTNPYPNILNKFKYRL